MTDLFPKSIMVHIPAVSNTAGETVSSMVYSAITATGDVTASATQSGIELAGILIGYGTELIAGPMAGATVRCAANSYSCITKHAISKGSRIGAIGASLLAYTGVALTTTAMYHGGNAIVQGSNSLYKFYQPTSIELKTLNTIK